jgi:hypothetical protein
VKSSDELKFVDLGGVGNITPMLGGLGNIPPLPILQTGEYYSCIRGWGIFLLFLYYSCIRGWGIFLLFLYSITEEEYYSCIRGWRIFSYSYCIL